MVNWWSCQQQQQQQLSHLPSIFLGATLAVAVPGVRGNVLTTAMRLQGDKTIAGDSPEKTLDNALWACKQEIKHHTENVRSQVSSSSITAV